MGVQLKKSWFSAACSPEVGTPLSALSESAGSG
jgi:hypothetical protein